jgi:hypothetical protein
MIDDWLMRQAKRGSQTPRVTYARASCLSAWQGSRGFAKSRGSLVFVNEPAKERTAAHVLGCCRLLERDRAVRW